MHSFEPRSNSKIFPPFAFWEESRRNILSRVSSLAIFQSTNVLFSHTGEGKKKDFLRLEIGERQFAGEWHVSRVRRTYYPSRYRGRHAGRIRWSWMMHREHHANAFEARLTGAQRRRRTDNRYSATPTLAGDKGLNGRQMHGPRRRNAPTSVDLERDDAPYVRTYFVYSLFVTKVRYVTGQAYAFPISILSKLKLRLAAGEFVRKSSSLRSFSSLYRSNSPMDRLDGRRLR